MSKKKRIILIGCFCLLLIATGIVNVVLNNAVNAKTNPTPVSSTTYTTFFNSYRTDRTSTRNQEIEYLNAILASATSSAEAKANAETERADLIKLMESELVLEGLIKAKGFEDAIISALSSNITVIVKKAELTSSEVAQLVEIITTQTNYTLENIKIVPVE